VQLFATVGNSLQAQPLTMGAANLLAVSPTNELAVVVNGTHNGQLETVDGVLATGPLAGSSPRQVLPDVRWADWDAHGQLAIVHYVDGHSHLEFPIGHVLYQSGGWISNIRFSPDGARIAFMDHPALWDDRGFVSVVDLAGNVRTLTREWEDESGLAWRPDGKEVWFTAIEEGNSLNLMAVDLSGQVRSLLDLPVGITLQDIATDGRVLVALNSSRLAMDFTTLSSTEEIDLSSHDWNSARDISPDGQFVLFEDASEAAGPGYSVMLRKVDGSLPIQLGKGSSGGFSPDGKWALSVSTAPAPEVTLLPTGTGQPRSVHLTGFDHLHNGYGRFLDDHRLIVNGDQAGHAPRCYVVELSTGKARAFTPEGITCGPSSPDSRFMVGKGGAGLMTIYSVDGGAQRPIAPLDPKFNPVQWSRDGSFLYGYRPGEFPSQVYKVEIVTGKQTVLKELKPTVPAGVVMVAPVVVSRDGTRFAYSYSQTLSVLYIVSGLQ
jgi:WD40 repeat protein